MVVVDQQLLRLLTPALEQGVGQGRLLRAQADLRDAHRSEGAETVHRMICTRDCAWDLPPRGAAAPELGCQCTPCYFVPCWCASNYCAIGVCLATVLLGAVGKMPATLSTVAQLTAR